MSDTRYNNTAVVLHWLTVLLVLCNMPLGSYSHDLLLSPTKLVLVSVHKWIGVTILLIVLARIFNQYKNGTPALPEHFPQWQRYAVHTMHALLYAMLIAIPITGWLLSSAKGVPIVYFGLIPLPDLIGRNMVVAEFLMEVHEFLNHVFLVLIIGHVLAALKHQFIDHDDILKRMMPWKK